MRWIDQSGDRDGDGFQEYKTRSTHGYYNQGWKDAGDAIPHADGSLAPLPLALCELQGYVYDAKLRMADIYEILGRARKSARLRAEARELYDRFNDAFWWEAEGTYYLGLDGDKRPIETVASNAGHCLASGIVPPERASRVVERLMAPDMWSGWGIRTLSSDHTAYNPFSYQTGSVWPHDNAHDRRRLPALRPRRRGGPGRARHVRGDRAVPGQPPARAVRRPAPRRGQLPGPVPRRQRPAGVGRRLDLPVRGDPVRDPRHDRPERVAAVCRSGAARLAPRADHPQPAGRRRRGRAALPADARSRSCPTRPASRSSTALLRDRRARWRPRRTTSARCARWACCRSPTRSTTRRRSCCR